MLSDESTSYLSNAFNANGIKVDGGSNGSLKCGESHLLYKHDLILVRCTPRSPTQAPSTSSAKDVGDLSAAQVKAGYNQPDINTDLDCRALIGGRFYRLHSDS